MPELPEVETTCRGIAPAIVGHRVAEVVVRQRHLRWPVPGSLSRRLPGSTVHRVRRRAKYILLYAETGVAIVHLGMSGSLRVVDPALPVEPHDHLDLLLDNGRCLRLRDPRRFGAVLWTEDDPLRHWLLKDLGPEPLSEEFGGAYLHRASRNRRVTVKSLLMNGRIVAGLGNIYASEALFVAGIHPSRRTNRISRSRYVHLAAGVRSVLHAALACGGTTLRDFVRSDGEPGYFALQLAVYARAGQPCTSCGRAIRTTRIGQRSTFYCAGCQR